MIHSEAKNALEGMKRFNLNWPNETPDSLTRKTIPEILDMAEEIREEAKARLEAIEAMIEELEYVYDMLEIHPADPLLMSDFTAEEQQSIEDLPQLLNEYNTLAERGVAETMTPTEGDRMLQLEELLGL